MKRSAIISEDGLYRYTLTRDWSSLDPLDHGYVNFIALNPSTADAKNDDPTIRRCVGFAKYWGYDQFVMTNLFAFRATEPDEMKKAADPIGPLNDYHVVRTAEKADLVIACWGTHGTFMNRGEKVKNTIDCLMCLQKTKDGHPNHPLYLPKNIDPIPL